MPTKYAISKPKPLLYVTSQLQVGSPTASPPSPSPPPPPPPPLPRPPLLVPPVPATKPQKSFEGIDPVAWSSSIPRPLSDIRELSEPSLMDQYLRQRQDEKLRYGRSASQSRPVESPDFEKHHALDAPKNPVYASLQVHEGGSSSYSSTPEQQSSFYSIPQSSIPRRSSSQKYSQRQARSHVRNPSIRSKPQSSVRVPNDRGHFVPNRGAMDSPVREVGLKLDAITSDSSRRVASRTYIRDPHPVAILEFPAFKHPRVRLELQVTAPVFVGGGSVEGNVKIVVDDNERVAHRRCLSIGAVSVDLLGFEELGSSRRSVFLALGTDIIDPDHPPPTAMIQPVNPLFVDDKFWSLAPSCSTLPFMISLPLDTGPPPFQSRHANIRFLLAVTAFLRDSGKHYRVRTSRDVNVIPTYDPEKALSSLVSPLTASDHLTIPRSSGVESIKVTAGLHRQVWVSGSSLFVDVHVANRTRKSVKRLELMLERDILCYKHTAAATLGKPAGQARVFESNEQTVLAKAVFKPGIMGFNGVEAHMSDTRTCELELPRGHATVRCGKYFEVRYFLNVVASLSNSKLVSVQLPIILVNMTSLDVVPNSVAQVAAAMEERRKNLQRSRSRSRREHVTHARQRSFSSPARTLELRRQQSCIQGRAFAAPRKQSLDRQREHRADMEDLRNIIDASPRRHPPQSGKQFTTKVGSNVGLGGLRTGNMSTDTLGVLGAMSYLTAPSCLNSGDGDGFRNRVRRIGSLDSMRSRKSKTATRSQHVHGRQKTSNWGSIEPYTLGLIASTRKVSNDIGSERSTSATSYRDKLDRSRFEFKAVRRKASGNLKGRGMAWWEQRKGSREKEKENAGWI